MSKANFYATFPTNPDELYDFPPQVIWKDEDADTPDEERITVKLKTSLTEDKTWDIKVSDKENTLLSFSIKHEYDQENSAWKWNAFNIKESEKVNVEKNIESLFNYCIDSSVLSLGYATDEIKTRKRIKP